MTEGRSERATGTPDAIYNLSSVLFHALEGGASYDTYVEDAEREGDLELADFFRRVRDEDSVRADDARLLLVRRTPAGPGSGGAALGVAAAEGAEGVSPGDTRREYAVTEMPDEDLTPPEEAVPPDAPGPPEASSRAEPGQPQRTEPISAPPGPGDVPSSRTEEASSRTRNDRPMTEEVTPGTPPQTTPRDVQRGGPAGEGVQEEERAGHGEEDRSLVERLTDGVGDALRGEGEQRRGRSRPDRR